MDGTDHHEARRRQMGVEKRLAVAGLDDPRLARADHPADLFGQRIGRHLGLAHQTLGAAGKLGHDDRGPPGLAFGVEFREKRAVHQFTRST